MKADVPFNITDLFFETARQFPENTAIVYKNQSVTYKVLADSVEETAQYFMQKGIAKGDRVLVFVPMSIDLYRIVLALFKMGATAVFLDEWVSKKRMEACCELCGCVAFIGSTKVRALSWLSSELRKIPIKLGLKYAKAQSAHDIPITTKNDTALITFTTGSTGKPKAAKRTHGFLHEQFNALIEKLEPSSNDVDMPVLPIVLLINLGVGCTSVIADFNARKPITLKPENIITQIKNTGVTRIVASPFFVKRIAQHLGATRDKLPNVHKIFTGGAPVFPNEAKLYNRAFPDAKIEIVYGSTEAEPISSISTKELIQEKNAVISGLKVGKPYHRCEVKIIEITAEKIPMCSEENLEKLEVKPGETGEIIVAGSHILTEYFNNPEAIEKNKIFVDDKCWHRTGDSGFLMDGELYLTGRCESLIEVEDGFLSPFLYENLLGDIDGISIGTVLKMNGKLALILESERHPLAEKDIRAQLPENLKWDEIRFVRQIPRDPRHNSKIDYKKLAQSL